MLTLTSCVPRAVSLSAYSISTGMGSLPSANALDAFLNAGLLCLRHADHASRDTKFQTAKTASSLDRMASQTDCHVLLRGKLKGRYFGWSVTHQVAQSMRAL